MALSDKLHNPPEPLHGTPCSIGALLETLEGDELAAFKAMLAAHGQWTATMIYDAVRDEGHMIGRQSIGRHRRAACRCFKDAA